MERLLSSRISSPATIISKLTSLFRRALRRMNDTQIGDAVMTQLQMRRYQHDRLVGNVNTAFSLAIAAYAAHDVYRVHRSIVDDRKKRDEKKANDDKMWRALSTTDDELWPMPTKG